MKKVILSLAIIAAALTTQAQDDKSFQLGGGINLGLPIGDAGDISSFAIGGELQGELGLSDNVKGLATVGYTHFIGKDLGGGFKVNYGIIPILVGARIYPSEKFFLSGQIGYGKMTGDADGGGFAYKPQVGYDAGKFQLALSYNAVSNDGTFSWLGLSGIFKF